MKIKDAFLRATVTASMALTAVFASALPAAAGGVRPNPSPQLPGDLELKMNTLLGVVMGVVIFACVLGVLIVAALFAVAARRGSMDDHFGRLGAVGMGCVLVGGASSMVMFLV